MLTRIGRQQAAGVVEERRSSLGTATLDVRLRPGGTTSGTLERTGAAMRRSAGNGMVTIEAGSATPLARFLAGAEADVVVGVRGEDFAAVSGYAERLRASLAREEALTDVRLGVELGQPEVRVRIDRDAVARYGLDVQRVATVVEAWMQGSHATSFVDFDRRIPVWVRLPEAERRSLASLQQLRVDGIPLRELVTTETLTGPGELRRTQQASVLPVLADIADGGIARAVGAAERAVAREAPPRGVRVEIGGESEEMRRSFISVAVGVRDRAAAGLHDHRGAVRIVRASAHHHGDGAARGDRRDRRALADRRRAERDVSDRHRDPGRHRGGQRHRRDRLHQPRARARECPCASAILGAGRARLRPILMTSATTILGSLPLALGFGSRARRCRPRWRSRWSAGWRRPPHSRWW